MYSMLLRFAKLFPSISMYRLHVWLKLLTFFITFLLFSRQKTRFKFLTIPLLSIFRKIIRKSCNRIIKFQSQVISQTHFPRLELRNLGKTCSTSITLQLPPITGTPTIRHSKNTPISLKFYRLQTRSHLFACFPFAVR